MKAPGQAIGSWWWDGNEDLVFNAPNILYKQQFFDAANPGTGTLDAKFQEIINAGNTPRFRGLFWFQGENDGGYNGSSTPNAATPDDIYKIRWNGFVDQIAADVGSSDFHFVVNTVGMVDPAINDTLASIASLDPRGAILDTQVAPYRDMEPGTTDVPNGDVHGYDHFAVGVANAQLFLDSFYSDSGSGTTYTITFVNVDGSTTTQTVNEGDTPTPPAGVNTDTRTFTGWPTIAAATANATYTAEYTETGGDIVDLFIATGQSNAAWPWDSVNQVGTFQFGAGVQAALTASGRFSNPTVVSQGEPGMAIENWFKDGAPQWAYTKNFFGTYQSTTAALEAKIAELEGQGKTVRFKGLFWFQGEADGIGQPNQLNTSESVYTERWTGLLGQLASDIGSNDFHVVMNTVGNSGNTINSILTNITNADARAALFNTQVTSYVLSNTTNASVTIRTNFGDIHGYDHYNVGLANVDKYIETFLDGASYTITFVNVDDSVTTQTVQQGEVATPPAGVNTAERTFTGWPTIAPAGADATYTAEYTTGGGGGGGGGGGSSSVAIALAQSTHGSAGSTPIDLTAEGNLDWGAWGGSEEGPAETMSGGSGYTSLTGIGGATFAPGDFYSQNNYSWSNGTPTLSGGTNLSGKASVSNGQGVKLTIDVTEAGTYQLKFYVSTFEVNLEATATLASNGTSDTVEGEYVTDLTVQRYQYTVDFTTSGADTLTLDMSKADGNNAIFAHEAFSLSQIEVAAPPELSISSSLAFSNTASAETYQIPFSNVSSGDALTVSSVTPGGADAAYFTVDSFTSEVAAGASGNIALSFNPGDGERTYSATLTIASNDPNAASTVVNISVDSAVLGLGKILCIGDSITEGSATRPQGEGSWSWRYAFWKHLVDNNVNHAFVGTSTLNYDPTNPDAVSVYPDYNSQSFVNRHEAYWGLAAYQVGASLPGNLATLKDQDETPDTAVIFLGGNDIFQDPTSTAEEVRDSIKSMIDRLQGDEGDSGNPNIRILLVSVLPRYTLDGGSYTVPFPENTLYDSINALLEPLAADETTGTSEVSYLDLATTFKNTADVFYDGVHPNGTGEQIEADAIFGALVEIVPTYEITFINVDGTQTTQTVNENEVATPPTGVEYRLSHLHQLADRGSCDCGCHLHGPVHSLGSVYSHLRQCR